MIKGSNYSLFYIRTIKKIVDNEAIIVHILERMRHKEK
jgi:hypothetical protein